MAFCDYCRWNCFVRVSVMGLDRTGSRPGRAPLASGSRNQREIFSNEAAGVHVRNFPM